MKYKTLIKQMTLEEKALLMSGKDFWTTQNLDRLGIRSLYLADRPHGVKRLAAANHHGLNPSIQATCFPTAATVCSQQLECRRDCLILRRL
ncbi:hypothetical protein [Paenibacillus graminis]|uniref:Uncharacterized protein n=1 Tax=Paenibacillus graminis TaxID=189425 RepID=A0A089M917_9BACL|nr:hypothetical protein [Paenibacillus graminis]AIQ70296.1 hypothetical protein PGRAT_23610 [Paenibacillus graminis]